MLGFKKGGRAGDPQIKAMKGKEDCPGLAAKRGYISSQKSL